MRPGQHLQEQTEARLERFRAPDRERARKRMVAGDTLSPYELDLLEGEYAEHIRAEHRRRAREAEAAEIKRKRLATIQKLRPVGIVFRTQHLERLNAHAIALCEAHDVAVELQYDGGGRAFQERRTIAVAPVTSDESYAVCLHELGHIVSPDADSRQFRYLVNEVDGRSSMIAPEAEANAWRFAVKTAIAWTRQMQNRLQQSLTHYAGYGERADRELMAGLVRDAALKIVDSPLRFNELDAVCKSIEGPLSNPAHVPAVPDANATAALKAEILAELKAQFPKAMRYRGVWSTNEEYHEGDVVTDDGSMWYAHRSTRARPKTNADWVLSCKRGRDGKDLR